MILTKLYLRGEPTRQRAHLTVTVPSYPDLRALCIEVNIALEVAMAVHSLQLTPTPAPTSILA